MLAAIIQIVLSLVGQMSRTLSKRPWIGSICLAAAAVSVSAIANAAGVASEDDYSRCRAIADERARLLCFDSLTPPDAPTIPSPAPVPDGPENTPDIPPGSMSSPQPGPSSMPIAGKWRLVRTPDPRAGREGKDIVSIMATAELSDSDVDFAGLNLRCADSDFEVLIFLIRPLRQQARPAVVINGKTFEGSLVSPGTVIRLPKDASQLAREQWRSLPNLSVEVEDDGMKSHGLISLEGFNTALQMLVRSCSTQ